MSDINSPATPTAQDSPASARLEAGLTAPNFTLPSDNGDSITLSALRGQNIVLYFYPAAMTVLTLVLLNTIVQPFLYRFSPYRAMAAIILSIGVIVGTVIGLRKALPEFEKTVEQLAEAISRHQAIALAAFLIIDVLALAFSSKISLHIYGSKDI